MARKLLFVISRRSPPDPTASGRGEQNQLVKPDDIGGEHELAVPGATVVCQVIEIMLPSKLRAKDDRAADPVVPGDAIFDVQALVAGALPPQIVEHLVAQGNEVMRLQLPGGVVEDSPLGSVAGELRSSLAPGAIGIGYQERSCRWIKYVRRMTLVLIPALVIHVPLIVNLVVPGGVVSSQVIVTIIALVHRVSAQVNVVLAVAKSKLAAEVTG